MKSRECGEANEIFARRENVRYTENTDADRSGEASLKYAGNCHCIATGMPASGVIEREIAGRDNRAQYRGYFSFYPRSKQSRHLSPRLIHKQGRHYSH